MSNTLRHPTKVGVHFLPQSQLGWHMPLLPHSFPHLCMDIAVNLLQKFGQFGWLQSAITTMHVLFMCQAFMLHKFYFSPSSVVSPAFSALCAYLTFGHYPYPLGYLCATFHFAPSTAELARGEKITYSISRSLTQSLTQLIRCPGNKANVLKTTVTDKY